MKLSRKKILTIITTLIIGLTLFSGCATKTTSNTNVISEGNKDKEIKVGLVTKDESCCTTPVDKQQGFQTDLWDEIGKRIGYKVSFKSLEENKITNYLDTGEIDTAVYKFSSQEEMKKNYEFTLPIIEGGITSVNQYPFKKDSKNNKFIEEVNVTLKTMNEDGTIKKIADKWMKED
jgi:ABC-type amino acid transport substrate-binding protein